MQQSIQEITPRDVENGITPVILLSMTQQEWIPQRQHIQVTSFPTLVEMYSITRHNPPSAIFSIPNMQRHSAP